MHEGHPGPEIASQEEAIAILRSMGLESEGEQAESSSARSPQPLSDVPRASPVSWTEESMRQVVEHLPDAVIVIASSGEIVLVNQQSELLFGYPRDVLLGQPIEMLVPQRVRETHVGHRQSYFRELRIRPMGSASRLTGLRRDGSEFPVEISLSPLRNEQGTFAAAVIRDISSRIKDEAKMRSLVENIPAVTFIAPLDRSVPELYVSPQIEQLLGFSQKEWLEDPILWYRQLHPDDQERWTSNFAPTCASGKPFRDVYRFIAKDNRVVWVHGSANLVRDPAGKLSFLQGIAFDITSIKEAEEERERFFSLAIDLFCVAGLDGYFKRINQAFMKTLGHSEQELLGSPFIEFVHPEDRAATLEEVRNLSRGALTCDFEHRFRCKDGSFRWLQWSAAPFLPRQLILAVARDITQQKQGEESLRQLNAELEQRVQERTEALERSMAELQEKTSELEQFAYVASHDLREPLRTLVNWPQRLARTYGDHLDPQAQDWIQRIINGAERMRRLIDDLSHYSRALRRDRAFTLVDFAVVVQEALANLQAALDESKGRVVVGDLPVVQGNVQQLMLLMQNLIGNAIKFRESNRPAEVAVTADRQEANWLITVRDNGIGIEEKYLTRIFGLGERLHSASKYPGTGFGLAICDKIVSGHGGRIWASSVLGQGSIFYFTVPVVSE